MKDFYKNTQAENPFNKTQNPTQDDASSSYQNSILGKHINKQQQN